MVRIASYVFFDIETTGLPWKEKNKTKITELCFIAALRSDIEEADCPLPRNIHKLSYVFNPQKQIHSDVTKITGISNSLLKNAPIFKNRTRSIFNFLEELPKPVCLVAHNGNTFDFKILLAEFNDAQTFLPTDLLCADSLVGFRSILKGTDTCYENLIVSTKTARVMDYIECQDLLTKQSEFDLLTDDESDIDPEDLDEIDRLCASLTSVNCDSSGVETSPQTKQKIVNIDNKSNTKVKGAKESYALTAIYKRILNKEEPDAHKAEVDCLMLLQCVIALKKYFLPWADDNCKQLRDIAPLQRY